MDFIKLIFFFSSSFFLSSSYLHLSFRDRRCDAMPCRCGWVYVSPSSVTASSSIFFPPRISGEKKTGIIESSSRPRKYAHPSIASHSPPCFSHLLCFLSGPHSHLAQRTCVYLGYMISTYSSVEVDSVLARNDIGDGGAASLLAGLDVGGHGYSQCRIQWLVFGFRKGVEEKGIGIG